VTRQTLSEGRKLLIGLGGVVVLVGAITVGVGAFTGKDGTAAYCSEVQERQQHLSETVASGDKSALLEALPDLKALAEKAPDDIAPSWETMIGALDDLEDAVASGDQEQVVAAATTLRSDEVTAATAEVQQQVRDVCHTPLTL
jgi:hypothetical protein